MSFKQAIPVFLFTSLFMVGNFSCGNSTENEKVLAKVGDAYLYSTNLTDFKSKADSIDFIKKYAANWINNQILIQYASKNLDEQSDDINTKVEKYRQELLLAEYEKTFLKKNLDTAITKKQIDEFYQANKNLFELRDYVVSVFYMKFDISEKNNAKIGADIKNCKTLEEAKKIEEKYASLSVNSYLEPNAWLFLSDLLREVPAKINDKAAFLENNSFFETATEDDIYYVRIFDYKLKNEASPVHLAEPKIKTMILQSRSQKLLSDNRNNIIKNFTKKNDVQDYTK